MSPVRTPERKRNTRVGFLLVFGVMASYSLLETARDAIFLARLPASRLPWAYLLTAALVSLAALLPVRAPGRARSAAFLLTLSGVVLGLYLFEPWIGPYAFYAGVNLVGTWTLVSVWTLVGAQFTVGEARRAFARIAAGGALGTTVGAALASRIVAWHGALSLAALAGIGIAIVSVTPFWLRPPAGIAHATKAAPIRHLARAQYARRILWMVGLITVATTIADFVFKSAVRRTHAPAELAPFFAHYQLAMSAIALVMQVLLAPMLLRRISGNRMVLVFPALLGSAALTLAILPGLAASLVLKGIDAALRNSIYRTSNEVLYLPLPVEVRSRLKAMVDGVGQRGAQALASLLTLGGLALGARSGHFALVAMIAAFAALAVAFLLRRQYVQTFRDQIIEGKLDPHTPVPQLDLESTESLVEMLSSPNDARVLAAVETLAAQRKARLIPSLLLYHPSSKIAARVLEIMSATGRQDVPALMERLLARSDVGVRRARVEAVALVALVGAGRAKPSDEKRLDQLARRGTREAKVALLDAIAQTPHAALLPVVARMAETDEADILLRVARAFERLDRDRALRMAVRLLAVREAREQARQIFLRADAIDFLGHALVDPTIGAESRRHIPRTLSRFGNERAAAVLLDALFRREGDGATRYKMLRGLGRMLHDHPRYQLDKKILEQLAKSTLRRAQLLRGWRKSLETVPSSLLRRLVARKEEMALERLFRFLDLLRPGEEMERVFEGLHSEELPLRSGSRELLEYLVPRALRDEVLAFVDDRSRGKSLEPREAVREMLDDHSAAVRRLADEWVHEQEEVRRAS